MPVTYIYRLPLYDAYSYGLVEEGRPRPDDLDEEGVLYQIITTDEKQRLVKVERYIDGTLSTERTIAYDGERPLREVEAYQETESACEVRYHYRPGGLTKEFYTDGELDRSEAYAFNENNVAVACRQIDAEGREYASWEANEKGDRLRVRDGGREVTFNHRYDGNGLLVESTSSDGKQTIRETFHYRDNVLVKHEIFSRGFDDGEMMDDAVHTSAAGRGDILVGELIVESDPAGRWEMRRRRQLVARGPGKGEKYWPSRVEVLFDERKRITDVLACDSEYIDPRLGINCEGNAYYFFEYED